LEIIEITGSIHTFVRGDGVVKVSIKNKVDEYLDLFFIAHKENDYALKTRKGDEWWVEHGQKYNRVYSNGEDAWKY